MPYRLKVDRIHAMTLLPFAAFNPTIDLKMGKLIPDRQVHIRSTLAGPNF